MRVFRCINIFISCIWAICIVSISGVQDLQPADEDNLAASFVETEGETQEDNKEEVSRCGKQKYQWQHKITVQCQTKFGPKSVWSFDKKSYCRAAFAQCRTQAYTQCCTQPTGPKKLETYCKIAQDKLDPACKVNLPMVAVKQGLKAYVTQLDSLVAYQPPATTTSTSTSTVTTITTTTDDGDDDAPAPGPVPALVAAPGPMPVPMPAPAPAPGPMAAPGPALAQIDPCTMLLQLTESLNGDLDQLQAVRDEVNDGRKISPDKDLTLQIEGVLKAGSFLGQSREFPPCRVLESCTGGPQRSEVSLMQISEDSEPYGVDDTGGDDDDDDPICSKEIVKNLTEIEYLMDGVEDAEDALHDLETKVHPHGRKWWRYGYEYSAVEGAIFAAQAPLLFAVQGTMRVLETLAREGKALTQRSYEAHSMHHYSFHSFLFQTTAITTVIFVYWVLSYMEFFDWLAAPSEEKMSFNFPKGEAFLQVIPDKIETEDPSVVKNKMTDIHLPLMGSSYFLTCVDVTMHTFIAFCLFELMMWAMIHKFVHRIMLFREFDNPKSKVKQQTEGILFPFRIWKKVDYDAIRLTFTRRVEGMEEYVVAVSGAMNKIKDERAAKAAREASGNKMPVGRSSDSIDNDIDEFFDLQDFPFHRYLTLHVRDATQALVEINLFTWLVIALFSLFGIPMCLYFKIDYVQCLLPMLIIFTIIFFCIYFEARRILAKKLEDGKEDSWEPVPKHRSEALNFRGQEYIFSVNTFCWFLQVCFMFICYSFARVMISYYFWTEETQTALLVTCSFFVFFIVVMWLGGEVITLGVICLAIPPYIPPEDLAKNFETLQREGFNIREDTPRFKRG